MSCCGYDIVFFFNDTATTEIYTLSLHDALPICDDDRAEDVGEHVARHEPPPGRAQRPRRVHIVEPAHDEHLAAHQPRSEEHTSELQSQSNLVCRLLLEKKKTSK